MNWTVSKWFPTNPSSGSLAVFLISGASDACEMVLLKGGESSSAELTSAGIEVAHCDFTTKSQKEPATPGLGQPAFLR